MLGAPHDHYDQIGQDAVGRLIAYGGGGAGLLYTELTEIVETASVADWASWMFGAAIMGRLIFDIVKYCLERSKK